eukprot:CAMPEP_0117528646 /NCGR_PEP_ID=MMETSP0784-20121206/37421_1 /TAXON_ID=39447 /ORGANISM="" /LENGTH=124 /DNA_ID=CAMNT_0005324937 /DNA_START=79 /DNA_END=453 /DNA_ORIENTATION=-
MTHTSASTRGWEDASMPRRTPRMQVRTQGHCGIGLHVFVHGHALQRDEFSLEVRGIRLCVVLRPPATDKALVVVLGALRDAPRNARLDFCELGLMAPLAPLLALLQSGTQPIVTGRMLFVKRRD